MQALASNFADPSILTPIGYQSGSCGYCRDPSSSLRTPDSRTSYYAKAKRVSPSHYQALVDRGWRRSGSLLYKPDVRRSCCPHYTIRLPVAEFKPSRDQRQSINRWNRHVLGDAYIKEAAKRYPKSKEEKARHKNSFDLVQTVHECDYNSLKTPPEPEHGFEVTLEPDTFTEEKYRLFEDYQSHVHHEGPDDISRNGFKRFLCSSCLTRTTRVLGSKEQKLGSFHQCYRLDGRLIAMGVIDLLPHCVSGVYFIYHQDFEKWSFGKLSALREAALALEGGYQYYYMGYYIHSCVKMRYKGDYKPQYVLDPESNEWNLLVPEVKALLDVDKYASPSRQRRINTRTIDIDTEGSDVQGRADEAIDAHKFVLDDPREASEAVYGGLSLFTLGVPGVMTQEELMNHMDLDNIALSIGDGLPHVMEDLVAWQSGSISDPRTLKGIVAEFAACVGPEVANEMVVNFGS